MFFDKENMFFDAEAGSGFASGKTSAAILNEGGGDAFNPLFLVVYVNGAAATAAGTAELQTVSDSAFTTPVSLGTFPIKSGALGLAVKAKVPYGMDKYFRLKVTAATTGTITAGLTQTVPNE